MGYGDDVVAFVHDGPTNGMAITIYGSLKSKHKIKRTPSRIPISVNNPYHYESDRESDRRQRGIECSLRDKDRGIFSQNIDARYFSNIKNRIKSTYSCNQEQCPMIKQRMKQHQMERHASLYNIDNTSGTYRRQDIDTQTGTTSDSSKRQRTATKSGPDLLQAPSIQTSIEINNYSKEMAKNHYEYNNTAGKSTDNQPNFNNNETETSPRNIYIFNNNGSNDSRAKRNIFNDGLDNIRSNNNNYVSENASDDNIPLTRTKTRELLTPKRNIYKDYVQKEVTQWFQEIPIYPNYGNRDCDKDDIINNLTEKIYHLLIKSNNYKEYNREITDTINSFLNSVPIWYPGANHDQDAFKNSLKDNLLDKIMGLNEKMFINNNGNGINENPRIPSKKHSLNNRESRRSLDKHINKQTYDEIEEEINNWLLMIKFKKSSGSHMHVDKKGIAEVLMKRLAPLLNKPRNSCNYKLTIKCAIVDILNDLPIGAKCSKSNIYLNRFAEDLTNRILSIQAKTEYSNKKLNTQHAIYQTNDNFGLNNTRHEFINVIYSKINKCLAETRFAKHYDVKNEIINVIKNNINSPVSVDEYNVQNEIFNVLKHASDIPGLLASKIVQNIIIEVKNALNKINKIKVTSIEPKQTRQYSVYTSENQCCAMNYPVTSTPKKNKFDKSVPKLNPEEIEYAENVGNLIRAWMETLPEQFNAPDERDFKDTMINDLAGEITDEAKLEQLASVDEKEKWLKYLIYKWLHKLNVFDLEEVVPQIEDLLKKLKDIPVPVLTRPQGGNRQAIANIKHMEGELGWKEYFVPKGIDILEDEISIWMNKQPSGIFDSDRSTRGNEIHDLAEVLQYKLTDKRSEKEISNDVALWLNKIVKPEQRTRYVDQLADDLKGKVINLPQDATLAKNRDKKLQQKEEYLQAKKNLCGQTQIVTVKTSNTENENIDKTMQQFIAKFIEHNYDVDDPLARGAFSHLLKTKLQRLNPPTRKEVYDNYAKSDHLSRNRLMKELEYIKDVSDWLKNIPIETSYNVVGNRERIDFVNNLAKNILEVEEQREADPEAMDYNMYMASIISQFLIQLPIIEEHKNDKYMMYMIDQLVGKIILHRSQLKKFSDSIDTSGVHEENIGDFIEEFIRVNGSEIADDEVKLEAWSARLLTEIKKMIRDDADPTVLSKANVYNRMTTIPIPGDESIKQFDNEFEYIKEISEWLKNLPLLPIDKSNEIERINMICGLTEKITERDIKKSSNPEDTVGDAEFAEYVSKWISDLSLDEDHKIMVNVVYQQLINRIDRVKTRQKEPIPDTNPNISKKRSSKSIKAPKIKHMKNPASAIVDAIDKWSASLPIKAVDEKSVKSIKDNAAKKLYQTVGELSIDPRTFNDDLLYQDILTDEVEAVIEKLPQNPELQKNKDKLKTEIVQHIIEAQKSLKANCAGEFYKQKLEHTIEASIPNPVKARQAYDPGFEIYKSRLADMFILENFDHANDDVKIKYERRVKDEIDKYFDSVKNKNAIPLTKDEIYYELYGALFKVPIPNESSVIGEVEEIKTRCEIDAWFEELPLKKADGLTELLERDKMLATLAKRIHEIEKAESKPADKIHKEIMKWLLKLPLLSKQESNLEEHATKLQDTLKTSSDKRKCFVTDPKSKKGKMKAKSKDKIKVRKDDSKVAESSTDGKKWESQVTHAQPKKKAAEIILEIVDIWCNQLPIKASTLQDEEEAKMIKDTLSTKIIIMISELNMNPETFNDDFYYNNLLDEEIDKLLSAIPTCCHFEECKAARIMQLKNAIQSIKPLFKEEKARHQYKQDLKKTVDNVLGKHKDITTDKEALFHDLKDEIVENFVQYNYEIEDDEGRQAYKIKVHDAVVKFLNNVVESKDKTMDALKQRNQLMCELSKIPIPCDSLKEEVEEIRMKNEISELFNDLAISDKNKHKLVNQVKSSLAKKLNDIELIGHDPENDAKMKQEMEKSLKKLNKEVKPEVIQDFVNKLKDDEIDRRASPKHKTNTTCQNNCKMRETCEINALQIIKKSETQNHGRYSHTNKVLSLDNTAANDKNVRNGNADPYNDIQYTKTDETCECPRDDFPQQNVLSTENLKDDNDSKTCLECNRKEFPQRQNQSSENPEDSLAKENGTCMCGMRKSRYPCYMPMRWYNSPGDMPFCRIPAFFYY